MRIYPYNDVQLVSKMWMCDIEICFSEKIFVESLRRTIAVILGRKLRTDQIIVYYDHNVLHL